MWGGGGKEWGGGRRGAAGARVRAAGQWVRLRSLPHSLAVPPPKPSAPPSPTRSPPPPKKLSSSPHRSRSALPPASATNLLGPDDPQRRTVRLGSSGMHAGQLRAHASSMCAGNRSAASRPPAHPPPALPALLPSLVTCSRGGDIPRSPIPRPSASHCCAACIDSDVCTAWTYDAVYEQCFLKYNRGE